ncbi:MAG: ATPase [Deltaproteobacteria bacterium]|nr:MAG: ATPase [Deltaproteobacteria bacterium]
MATRATSGAGGPRRRDRLIREREHDTYKSRGKLPDPTVCPECEAVFRRGRWRWGTAAFDAPRTMCPACRRVADRYPAGYVEVRGRLLDARRDEILHLIQNIEAREKSNHPLKRIIETEEGEDGIVVTTTDMHLARNIGQALRRACQGTVNYEYTKEGNVLRVTWEG